MNLPDRLYLTGFMGSGKSTIAPLLADQLSFNAIDLDEIIEAEAGMPIPQIFEEDGEAQFRKIERTVLERTIEETQAVISLGGGAITFTPNLTFVRANGLLVYLNVPIEHLVERLYGERGRPLLYDAAGDLLSKGELYDKISAMLAERSPYYRQADIIVDAGEPTPEETAHAIVVAVQRLRHRA